MKKPTLKRLGLGLLQQLMAMGIMVVAAWILFNSYVAVNSMNGMQKYAISPWKSETVFEDSEIFQEIFGTAVSDIMHLVVIKEQLEENGSFAPDKYIDITRFADRGREEKSCSVTAVYPLESLIKWGKYGIEYTNRSMSMSDYVNYFGSAIVPENFALDENGQLYFAGFFYVFEETEEGTELILYNGLLRELKSDEQYNERLQKEMARYTKEQLEDMAFSYIMSNGPEELSVSREDDGSLTVYFPMISCRYETVDGEKQLVKYADNWVDYAKLQSNLAETITTLTESYRLYQSCNDLYLAENSNLSYTVRMNTDDGIRTFTNVPEMKNKEASLITDYYSEYRRYLIYYPDNLEFMGNTGMTEEAIYQYLNEYGYAYPETTHIWIGIDTNYPVRGDAFDNAGQIFGRIVPNISLIICICIFFGLVWLGLGIYLTMTAGVVYDENQGKKIYLNGIDHIWTEIMLAALAGMLAGEYMGCEKLLGIANAVYVSHSEAAGDVLLGFYQYGAFAAYGFVSSMLFNLFWYSIVRRGRARNLWKDSFLHWLFCQTKRGIHFVLSHRNTAVSTLIPYNMFLLFNLLAVLLTYLFRGQLFKAFIIVLGAVLADSIVGVLVFRHKAEQLDIVDGINRIRDGEVDYKLDTEVLHGDNREMADAVNNIGEGIRNAVKTSMKDEQMKTDLITNVSHDIKTPLTSIINYVDLLKRLKIEEEPAKSYIAVLDNKSQRLKQLADDLVEASKISSGNIVLNRERLNLTELLNQAIGEFSDKLEEKRLKLIFEDSECPAFIFADSRRMWRIIENLFHNIYKYAMEGTRVYVGLSVEEGRIEVSMKNISERQMNIRPEELTERFIRGDASRTTEGSGLGLSIAKNLTRLHGGEFEIYLDGDLFKVMLRFPEYAEEEQEEIQQNSEEES